MYSCKQHQLISVLIFSLSFLAHFLYSLCSFLHLSFSGFRMEVLAVSSWEMPLSICLRSHEPIFITLYQRDLQHPPPSWIPLRHSDNPCPLLNSLHKPVMISVLLLCAGWDKTMPHSTTEHHPSHRSSIWQTKDEM